jgi:hypothetical protein
VSVSTVTGWATAMALPNAIAAALAAPQMWKMVVMVFRPGIVIFSREEQQPEAILIRPAPLTPPGNGARMRRQPAAARPAAAPGVSRDQRWKNP